jgi:predicted P-loop ATPase
MLVLQGGQGVGKSTLARALVKKIGTSYYYAGAIDPNDKDHKMKLAQLFLWEPDELGGTTAYADINRLKSLLTLTRVNERPPYGRYVVDMDVVCSFLGTTNDASFLTDTTGSRRFLVAKFEPVSPVETINWLRGVEFDPNLLWGEVYDEVLRTGDKAPMLGQEDLAEAISRAESVRKRDDIEVVLEDLLEVQPVGEKPTEEWRLYRKDLRTALSDADVRLGRGTMRQAGEIIAKLVGFRDHWDAMGNINGERYFRRVRLRSSIIPPPTFSANKN